MNSKKKKKKEENCKFHKQTLLESGGFVGVLPLSLQVWEHREPPLILCTQNPGSLWTTSPGAGRKAFPHPMAHLDPRLFCLEGKWHSSKTFWSFLTPHLALMSRWVKFAAKDEFAKRTQVLPAACELVSSPNSETGRASSPHTINHPFNWWSDAVRGWQLSVHGCGIEGSLLCCIPALESMPASSVTEQQQRGQEQEDAGAYLAAEQCVGDSWGAGLKGSSDMCWGGYQTSERLQHCSPCPVRGFKQRVNGGVPLHGLENEWKKLLGQELFISFSGAGGCFSSQFWYFLCLFSFPSSLSQGL